MNTLKTKSVNDNYLSKLAVGKSLLKEYKTSECTRTVYLNDGDEFQIQLFNSETIEIGAEIFIDGEPLSNIIILNPGERMWLERYTDKAKKFKFKVYTVDGDSKEVEKAIAKNGEIEIKFYRKKKPVVINNYHIHYPETYRYDIYVEPGWRSNMMYYNNDNSITTCSAGDSINSVNFCSTLDVSSNISTSSCTSTSTARTCRFEPAKASFNYGESSDGISWASLDDSIDPNLIETGRVGEGSNSNQRFQEVSIDLETFSFKIEKFKILPYSRKPFTVNDTKKIYCSNCGRKLNSKFKFCPYCGEEID